MAKSILNIDEAAELLGVTAQDLMLSRMRGLEPGRLGFKRDGELVWRRKDLPKPQIPAPADDDE